MGCSGSKDSVPVTFSENYNKRNMAWSDEVSLPPPESKPVSASSRKSTKKSKLIRVRSANSSTAVEDITADQNAMLILKKQKSETGSMESLDDGTGSSREVSSASSKSSSSSTCTYDSGLEADCPGMITEHSHPTKIHAIEKENRPTTPDLSLSGTKIQSRNSSAGKGKPPQTTAAILGELQSQGLLLAATTSKTQNSMSFEVMIAPEFGILKRPPPRLAKLKKRKKKQRDLTKEEVEEKLKAAEERRKKKEAKMIARLNTSAKERNVHAAHDSFVQSQQIQTQSKMTHDLDAASQRREEHFKSRKLKSEEKRRHAEKVREAKLERLAQTPVPPDDRPTAMNDPEDDSLV